MLNICSSGSVPHKWPLLTHVEDLNVQDWRLNVFGSVSQELQISWPALHSLAKDEVVTRFSTRGPDGRLRRRWRGVSTSSLLDLTEMDSHVDRVLIYSEGGYITDMHVDDFFAPNAVLAYCLGSRPIGRSEGGPLRLVMPHMQSWKCARWVRGIELVIRPPH